jgi:hypothetical protein
VTTPPPGALRVQYKNNDGSPTDSQIKPGLTLVNGGTSAIPLSQVTLRYYFSSESGSTNYTTNCDYARVGCANVTSRIVTMGSPVAGADRYLEVGFTAGAGSVPAGGSIGDLQMRFNKNDWSGFNEANDYSYGTGTSYADWARVPAYVGAVLTWGGAPA